MTIIDLNTLILSILRNPLFFAFPICREIRSIDPAASTGPSMVTHPAVMMTDRHRLGKPRTGPRPSIRSCPAFPRSLIGIPSRRRAGDAFDAIPSTSRGPGSLTKVGNPGRMGACRPRPRHLCSGGLRRASQAGARARIRL